MNNLNARINEVAKRTLQLYNCQDPMRVESPAQYPKISTIRSVQLHPHQSIFYDRQNVLDEESDPVKKRKNNEALGLPELYSMQFNKKIYNISFHDVIGECFGIPYKRQPFFWGPKLCWQ